MLAGALVVSAFALVAVIFHSGCSTDTGAVPEPRPPDGLGVPALRRPVSLETVIVKSDVIAKVKLVSVAQVVEKLDWPPDERTLYAKALEFKFEVLEYLKGSGGSHLVAVAYDLDSRYETKQSAAADGQDFLNERDTRWDDREAIVFLADDIQTLPSSKQPGR